MHGKTGEFARDLGINFLNWPGLANEPVVVLTPRSRPLRRTGRSVIRSASGVSSVSGRRPTLDGPPTFAVPPPAPSWYRFAFQSPSVAVVLAAARDRAELEQDLDVLNLTSPLDP